MGRLCRAGQRSAFIDLKAGWSSLFLCASSCALVCERAAVLLAKKLRSVFAEVRERGGVFWGPCVQDDEGFPVCLDVDDPWCCQDVGERMCWCWACAFQDDSFARSAACDF